MLLVICKIIWPNNNAFRAARGYALHSVYPETETHRPKHDQAEDGPSWRSPLRALPLVSRDGQFPETVLIGAENPWIHPIGMMSFSMPRMIWHCMDAAVGQHVSQVADNTFAAGFPYFLSWSQRFVYHS
jgi:hypothetical protein